MGKQQRIMVVDDEPGMLQMIRLMLELEGYRVDTASDGKAALEMYPEAKPDLILLDIMMPGLDGFQVLAELRRTSNVPVIMLTAKGELENKAQTLFKGADDYVTKPFMTRELIARIRAKLRRSGKKVPELPRSSALGRLLGAAGERCR